jgi:hypothetical protein
VVTGSGYSRVLVIVVRWGTDKPSAPALKCASIKLLIIKSNIPVRPVEGF